MYPIKPDNEGLPAIEIKNLTRLFGQVRAVDDLSFTMNQCEIFGLLGPNGSGKTTTINMVSGLTAPTSGEIHVMGYDLRTHTRQVRQLLGAVPQETALYEELSAWANMDFHAELFGIPVKEKKERITQMLELVQLMERKDARVSTYSGGMKRRLALARALLHHPSLIYLDEPTLGVDVQSRRAIWDYIRALRKECRSILITTNYLEEAQALCDRIAILDHGKLIAIDTPDGLKRAYGGSVLELETTRPLTDLSVIRGLAGVKAIWQEGQVLKVTTQGDDHAIPQVINLVAQVDEIRNITVREPNLDEVFLHLTGTGLRD